MVLYFFMLFMGYILAIYGLHGARRTQNRFSTGLNLILEPSPPRTTYVFCVLFFHDNILEMGYKLCENLPIVLTMTYSIYAPPPIPFVYFNCTLLVQEQRERMLHEQRERVLIDQRERAERERLIQVPGRYRTCVATHLRLGS
jgi:hypothetical protein